ncbi:FG-GAP-like repeat-containing protein [Microbacterium sp. 22215]|uniref:FG-GAP-like repeat-containing protein n=1 Tax=Microbacterium sp. 22215 TaxID=3453893 RepID=UPI003F8662F1
MAPSPTRRPALLRRATAAVVIVLAAAVLVPTSASAAGGVAGEVFSLTNAQRTQAGLRPLISDPALDAAAAEWARHLASTCTFEHSTSQWRSTRVAASGWIATGENIAAGQPDASSVMTAWMGSAGHKANILDSRYTGLGVGYATGSCYRSYWVQIFGIGSPVKKLPGGAGDLTSDRNADIVARTASGSLVLYPGTGKSGLASPITLSATWGARTFTTLGDFTGDGIPDLARVEANGRLMLYAGDGRGALRTPTQIGTGWSAFTQLIGGIDFNGDRLPDIIAKTTTGALKLYKGNGKGGFLSGGGAQMGSGWNAFDSISHAGDFSGDSRGDIIARKTSDGTLWLYPTTGKGTWGKAVRIGTGWRSFTAIFGGGDLNGDGAPDVVGRASDGTLWLYPGNGRGGFLARQTIGSGWSTMAQIG